MTWIKLDDKCPGHPKIGGLSDRAFRAWITSICYASAYLTDGELPPTFLRGIPARVRDELTTAALWVARDGGTHIHDYLDHQASKAVVVEKRRKDNDRKKVTVVVDSTRNPDGIRDDSTAHAGARVSASVSVAAESLGSSEGVQGEPRQPRSSVATRARALGIVSAADWHRAHSRHVSGFCAFVCLPQTVFDDFARRVLHAGAASETDAAATVTAWAQGVQSAWEGRIPGADIFEFWRNEWAATHGSNKPASAGGTDPLSGVREALRRV